ncbi:hypothetical protein EMGBS8_17500 [Verrucomicrobiota bacterium]|jgi:hypothetical protein|nr:hypothetical protein EMGBS8_17500 [Verrucomicrobiota bacterium]
MPLQLIFTSAPRGLVAGRSGFCTVARHASLSERLTQQLEALGTPHDAAEGETFTFRRLEAGSQTWYVLSRFVARGLDYSQRDNRLAHHVVFTAEEAAVLPPPAAVALRWNDWKDTWSEEPTWLKEDTRPLPLASHPVLTPAAGWREFAGTGAKAAWLVNASGAASVSLLNPPSSAQLLRLLAESSALLGRAAWSATFTTNAAKTGADGFDWAVGYASGRPTIDLAQAAQLTAPTGELARVAATGAGATAPASAGPTASSPRRTNSASAPATASNTVTIAVVSLLVLVAAGLAIAYFSKPEKKVVETTKPTPPPIDSTAADELLKANRAITDVDSFMARNDFVAAGKLWLESCKLSPTFAARYREQYLPRLKSKFADTTTASLLGRLESPTATANRKSMLEIAEDAAEALRIGMALEVTKDAAWEELTRIQARAQMVGNLDVRPIILTQGEWLTADVGPNSPSTAEFKLSMAAAEKIGRFIDATGANKNKAISARIRLLPLESFHARDERTKYQPAEIRTGSQANWIEATSNSGQQPIVIGVGSRLNTVTLNFADNSASQLRDTNQLIEIELADGSHQTIALITNVKALRPLNLGLAALKSDVDTGVVHAAAWAEPIINSFIASNGSLGLYPAGHEFPDRDLASIRATKSLLDTDLVRLERKSGPGAPSYDEVKARRSAFTAQDFVKAGAPWSLRTVSPRGEEGLLLVEFR